LLLLVLLLQVCCGWLGSDGYLGAAAAGTHQTFHAALCRHNSSQDGNSNTGIYKWAPMSLIHALVRTADECC
jgi:hypothetical protein